MDHPETVATLPQILQDHDNFDVSFPLRGVVLCCTSIPPEERTDLASQAEQMGAQHKYDLTSEVTHLIAGEYDTPKYRYVARERPDVRVLKASWIGAVRQLWIEDGDINLVALQKEHILPTFASLKICLTGFEDPAERKAIGNLICAHGGEYSGDLTKSVSHLLAYRPEGAKYTHAKSWRLKIVSIEWLHDSIERGMILDETLYSLDLPPKDRGRGAWTRHHAPKSPLGKRTREDVLGGLGDGKRRLRRTASTKLTSQNEKIWGDIVGGGSAVQAAGSEHSELLGKQEQDRLPPPPAVLSGTHSTQLLVDIPRVMPDMDKRGVFSSCQFYLHGFRVKQDELLWKFLVSHDASVCSSAEDLSATPSLRSYIIVPHSMPKSDLLSVPSCQRPIEIVTEFWIERCIEAKGLVELGDYALGRPFPIFPVEGFRDLRICSTGFTGLELLHLSKSVTLLGATYEESFSNAASVLICNPNRPVRVEKLNLAIFWKVPVVATQWLLDSINLGIKQAFTLYLSRPHISSRTGSVSKRVDGQETLLKQDTMPLIQSPRESSEQQASKKRPRHAQVSDLGATAFGNDELVMMKNENTSRTMFNSCSTVTGEALKESSHNSPRNPSLSPTSIPGRTSNPVPHEDLNTAITSLLAKSKPAASHQEQPDQADGSDGLRRKRTTSRILGRAASNVSSASATMSRASSVDSTASAGQAVIWHSRSRKNISDGQRNKHLQEPLLLNGTGPEDEQPVQTQRLQYEDTESNAYREQVVARMTGSKIQKKEMVRVATVASLDTGETPKPRRLRQRVEQQVR
ncbi:MAG: hypothetical protein M1818_001429 [Claussenomyces sp. TS43310]|nr:MAG: hypothetical protein M1818_001429 [Claussenomyces sp. TS43310]